MQTLCLENIAQLFPNRHAAHFGSNVRFLTNVILYFNEHTGHLEILLTQRLIELRLGCDLRI